jgi:hypothetical protein
LSGILLVTTLLTAITPLSPMVTPDKMITLLVIPTLFPIIIGFDLIIEKLLKSCVDVIIILLQENEQLFLMVIGTQAKIKVSANLTFSPMLTIGAEQKNPPLKVVLTGELNALMITFLTYLLFPVNGSDINFKGKRQNLKL